MCADRERLLSESTPLDTPERRALAGEQREQEVLALAGRHVDALARARGTLERLDESPDVSLLARAVHDMGNAQANAGELAGAEANLRRGVQEAARARDHRLVADGWNRLLILIGKELGRPGDAIALEPAARAAVAQAGDDPVQRATLETTLGTMQLALGHFTAARDHFIAARDRFVAARGPDHPHVASAEANLARAYREMNQPDDAERSLDRSIAIMRQAYGERHPAVARAHGDHASLAASRKDWASSERHARAALAIYQAALGASRPETARARISLARALRSQERLPEARAELERGREGLAAALPPTHPELARLTIELARIAEAAHDHAEAERLDRSALASLRASLPPDHPELQYPLAELARMVAYRAPAEALDLYDEALRGSVKTGRRALASDVEILADLGECALAAHLPRRGLAWFEKMPEAGSELPDLRARLDRAADAASATAAGTRRHAGR
jgi:tetratricopeptide (TPR) repeat protein